MLLVAHFRIYCGNKALGTLLIEKAPRFRTILRKADEERVGPMEVADGIVYIPRSFFEFLPVATNPFGYCVPQNL